MTRTKVFIFFLFLLSLKSVGQTNNKANKVDSICLLIDSVSKSFKKVAIRSIARGGETYNAIRLYYIDTLDKRYRKVSLNDINNKQIKTFYFEHKRLLAARIEKNTITKRTAEYQFENDKVIYKKDLNQLIRNSKELLDQAKEFLEDPVISH